MDYSKLINASDEEDNITAFIAVYLGKFGNLKKGKPLHRQITRDIVGWEPEEIKLDLCFIC